MVNNTYNYLLSDLKKLKGVGQKTYNILKKKKINNIFDLLDYFIVELNNYNYKTFAHGEMAERLKAPVLKTGKGATLSWVRIPVSPPYLRFIKLKIFK